MTIQSEQLHQRVLNKAIELGISEDVVGAALHIICRNRNLVNAIDHAVEMDDYIYRSILSKAFEKRKARAEADLNHSDHSIQLEAEKDLKMLSREELGSDAFYRAVLPLIVKTLNHEPILRLHAEEASTIVLELADFKRRHRATSLTEVIVKKCSVEIAAFQEGIE